MGFLLILGLILLASKKSDGTMPGQDWFNRNIMNGPGRGRIGVANASIHWYRPMSDGEFEDMIDDLRAKGLSVAGARSPYTAEAFGAVFAVVHDVEGQLRVQMLDHGTDDVATVWSKVDNLFSDYKTKAA
jgi:hypothetical protein